MNIKDLPQGSYQVVNTPVTQQKTTPKYASAIDRLLLSFGNAQGKEQYLQKKGIAEENVNKPGFDMGDITSKVGTAIPAVAGTIGAIAGAPTLVGAGILGGAAAAGGEGIRQQLGRAFGTRTSGTTKELGQDLGAMRNEGLINAIAPKLGEMAGKVGAKYVTKVPEKLYARALKLSKSTIEKMEAKGMPLSDIVNLGQSGSLEGMSNKALKMKAAAIATKNELLQKNKDKLVDVSGIVDNLISAADEALKVGDKARHDAILKFADVYDNQLKTLSNGTYKMTVGVAEESRSKIAKSLGDKFLSDANVKSAQRIVQGVYKTALENSIDEIGGINKIIRLSTELQKLSTGAQKGGTTAITAINRILASVVGSTAGSAAMGPVGIGVGAGAGIAGLMGVTSPVVRTTRAQAIKAGGRLVQEGIKKVPAVKPAAQFLLRSILGGQD